MLFKLLFIFEMIGSIEGMSFLVQILAKTWYTH